MWWTSLRGRFDIGAGLSDKRSSDLALLPDRVRNIVREQDRESERVLGLVQLAFGLLVAVVYYSGSAAP